MLIYCILMQYAYLLSASSDEKKPFRSDKKYQEVFLPSSYDMD